MVWADTRLGQFGSFNQKIGFARLTPLASPSIFLSPPSGSAGKDFVIQGFNFQPEQDIFIEVAGAIVATARSSEEGRFSASLFTPISGQGAHDVRATDASGNMATASFYTEYGFDSLRDSFRKTTQDVLSRLTPIEATLSKMNLTQIQAMIQTQAQTAQRSLEGRLNELTASLKTIVGDQFKESKADQQDLKNRLDAVSLQVTNLSTTTTYLAVMVAITILFSVAALVMARRPRVGQPRSAAGEAGGGSGPPPNEEV